MLRKTLAAACIAGAAAFTAPAALPGRELPHQQAVHLGAGMGGRVEEDLRPGQGRDADGLLLAAGRHCFFLGGAKVLL